MWNRDVIEVEGEGEQCSDEIWYSRSMIDMQEVVANPYNSLFVSEFRVCIAHNKSEMGS